MIDERVSVVIDFISAHRLAVVATCTPAGTPECALLAYAARGGELVIVTDTTTRKYENLKGSPRVAVVIGWEGPVTLQYEGEAAELEGERAQEHAALVLRRHPETAPFLSRPTSRAFLIQPRWARFTDYSARPPDIFELHF